MKEITDKGLSDALNHIAALDEGQLVLAYLADWCGFGKSKLVVRLEDTYANAAIERVYINLRSKIRPEYLKAIENDYKRKAVKNDRSGANTTNNRNASTG